MTDQGPTLATPGHQQPEPAQPPRWAQPAIINPAGRSNCVPTLRSIPSPIGCASAPIHRPRRRVITPPRLADRHENVGK